MRLHWPTGLACLPIACTAMWLTTAVVQAQGIAPGAIPAKATEAANQVTKPAVTQVTVATTSAAATAHQGVSDARKAAQHAAGSAPAPAASVASTTNAAQHTVAPKVAQVVVPATPPPSQGAVSPPPPTLDLPPTLELSPALETPAAPDALSAPAVPAVLGTPATSEVAVADESIDEPSLAITDPDAIQAATESIEAVADPGAVTELVGPTVESVVPIRELSVVATSVEEATAAAVAPDAMTESGLATSSIEPTSASAATSSAAWTPAGAPLESAASGAILLHLTDTANELIPPSTANELTPPSTANEPISPTGQVSVGGEVTLVGADLAVDELSDGSSLSRWPVLAPNSPVRTVDDRAAGRSSADSLAPDRFAFAGDDLRATLNTGLAGTAFDAARIQPVQQLGTFELLPGPDVGAAPSTGAGSSGLMGAGGASAGAASPNYLALLLKTHWRSLDRLASSLPASIALASLAPPG